MLVAGIRGTMDYSMLNPVIAEENQLPPFDFSPQPGRDVTGQLLVEISQKTHANYGILLTALVMHKGNTHLGQGFYKIATNLGRMPVKPTVKQKDEALSQLTAEVHGYCARPKTTR